MANILTSPIKHWTIDRIPEHISHSLNASRQLLIFLLFLIGCNSPNSSNYKIGKDEHTDPASNWHEYNGDGSRSHYSKLSQITKANVGELKPAWTYSSGGAEKTGSRTEMQCNPIIINGILYGVSANTQVFALDAFTGKELWKTSVTDNGGTTSRGVAYHADSSTERIFFGAGKWLYAFDAKSGMLLEGFGDKGRLNLQTGLMRPGADDYVVSNTPNTIFKDLVITGVRVSESQAALLGDIRAYNVYTGKLAWTFRTIPAKGDTGYDTWLPEPRSYMGGANAWAGMAIDRERGIVYIPTGSAAFDFFGGNRKGNNLFANCLLALNAATGERLWHYQLVHHDIWDRDPPAPPNLVTIIQNGVKIDAVAQVTKQGQVFVFNRVTGEPVFEIQEKAFSTSGVTGEYPSPTQPIPIKPAAFTRQSFSEKDFNSFVAGKDSLVKMLRKAHTGSPYIPIQKDMTILYPSTGGGAQWGGAASDPDGILYVPGKDIVGYTSLEKIEQLKEGTSLTALKLYNNNCAACHGKDQKGNHDGSYPSILGIGKRLPSQAIEQVIAKGRGMMPSFSHIPVSHRQAIIDFLLNIKKDAVKVAGKSTTQIATYQNTGYNRWYDSNGYPVNRPPWGTLTAIDLNTGEHKWQVALGEYKALVDKGIAPTGTDNYGGPLVTATGLIFIAATRDEKFRAFDKSDGKMLWQTQLPAGGYASPSTYAVNGRQFIVIACGGGKFGNKSGDKYVAFALGD
ncbi:MAG: PQQ-binding-like beta-propeller repeat protein [Chitinophagaceae bacterium]